MPSDQRWIRSLRRRGGASLINWTYTVRLDADADKVEITRKLEDLEKKSEAEEKVDIAKEAIVVYKQSNTFVRHMSDFMRRTIMVVWKKVPPDNARCRWNTRDMIRRVQRFFSDKRPLTEDSDSKSEEEGAAGGNSGVAAEVVIV
ncbi:unnamed protein product [Linum trigynum]|uniref:Uncharacterized protein n=1 Tax=Linum trigynum TaxID=586398 RepID=A0AAV2DV79_9ROSI